MSDRGWNDPQQPPPPQGGGWSQQPPPPQPGPGQGGQPPPPQQPDQGQWGQPPAPQQPAPPQDAGWGQQPAGGQGGQGGQWGQQPQQWGGQGGAPGGSSGLDPKIAGILAYVPFGWLGGLVVYLVNKDPLSRFHGAQSILLSIAAFVLFVGITIISFVLPDLLGLLFSLVTLVIWLGLFGLSIYLAIQGYNLKKVTLPVIGPIAESWATK